MLSLGNFSLENHYPGLAFTAGKVGCILPHEVFGECFPQRIDKPLRWSVEGIARTVANKDLQLPGQVPQPILERREQHLGLLNHRWFTAEVFNDTVVEQARCNTSGPDQFTSLVDVADGA